MELRKDLTHTVNELYKNDVPLAIICKKVLDTYGVSINVNEIRWIISYDTPLRHEQRPIATGRILELARQRMSYPQIREKIIEEYGFKFTPKVIGRIVRGE